MVSAANGVEGLHKYRLYKDDIALVICDVTMPEMDGPTLVMRLLREQPEQPIIMLSDHCESIDLGSQPNLRFIPKPFSLSTLLSTVRSLISKRESFSATRPRHEFCAAEKFDLHQPYYEEFYLEEAGGGPSAMNLP